MAATAGPCVRASDFCNLGEVEIMGPSHLARDGVDYECIRRYLICSYPMYRPNTRWWLWRVPLSYSSRMIDLLVESDSSQAKARNMVRNQPEGASQISDRYIECGEMDN